MKKLVAKHLGELLIERKLITPENLAEALQLQEERGGLIGQILIALGYTDEVAIAQALTTQYGFPYLPLSGYEIDPEVAKLPLMLTESLDVPNTPPIDRLSTVATALRTRQDLRSLTLALETDDLTIRQVSENLRPILNLGANYSTQGLGNGLYKSDGTVPGALGGSLRQLLGFSYPSFSLSLTLQLPIRDRRTSADLADALVNKKINAIRMRSQEQQIRLQVLNAIDQVENSRASAILAKTALDLALKRVEADEKQYELGTTTIFFVLASQSDLAQAAGTLVRESVNYRRNLLQLYQRTGQLLERRNVLVR